MTTPRLTSCLAAAAALLFATAVQAGDISMDAGGMYANSGARNADNGANRDCAAASTSLADGGQDTSSTDRQRSTGATISDRLATDNGDASADATGSSGSGAADSPIAAPIKARSNRWQSLVPGAIK